jgi:mevalonate kinase
MTKTNTIVVSAPGKIHLLGEHTMVYGKPALLAAVNLRISISIASIKSETSKTEIQKIVEPIIKKELKIKTLPQYRLTISSEIPVGAGLGSSAAVSSAYIAALLSFLKVKWDLNLINKLAYEAEKVFHGNPSGGDNSTVVFGGLIWFRKESPDLKLIEPVPFTIPNKLAKNFCLINTGKPQETTKQMVEIVAAKFKLQSVKFQKIFDDQERLVKELLSIIQNGDENHLIQTIRAGEKNLESLGVVSPFVKTIIRKIEQEGGAAKICGAGGRTKATGILLAYHPQKSIIEEIAKEQNLSYFSTSLGIEGVKYE